MSVGTRPDAPTGGRLVIKKGATWDTEYHSARDTYRRSAQKEAIAAPKKRRRCLFCGRSKLLVLAPVIVVVVFAARYQRGQLGSGFATLAGYTITLDAVQDSQGTLAAVLIRPGNKLAALLGRAPAAEPGTVVEVLFTAQASGELPTLLSGRTPAGDEEKTILQTRLETGALIGAEVYAEVSIGGETATLTCAVEPPESKP